MRRRLRRLALVLHCPAYALSNQAVREFLDREETEVKSRLAAIAQALEEDKDGKAL